MSPAAGGGIVVDFQFVFGDVFKPVIFFIFGSVGLEYVDISVLDADMVSVPFSGGELLDLARELVTRTDGIGSRGRFGHGLWCYVGTHIVDYIWWK